MNESGRFAIDQLSMNFENSKVMSELHSLPSSSVFTIAEYLVMMF